MRRAVPEHGWTLRALAFMWLLALVLTLSACGGGESDEDDHKDTTPPQCEQHPEQCQ